MKFGIVTFPGSNCDYDAYRAVVDALGEEAVYLWHKDHDLHDADVIILPGGFSYGDYLRAGAIAALSPIMREVVQHAKRGGPVLGICNGFQIACEARLLPGALLRNASLKFVCAPITLRVENECSRQLRRRSETVDARRECHPAEVLTGQVCAARQAVQISVQDLSIGQSLSRDRIA